MKTQSAFNTLLITLLLLFSGLSTAGDNLVFESCTDSHGRTLPVIADGQQAMLVRGAIEQGRRVIRYNPDALPRLSATTRLFFYAHQCARAGITNTDLSAERARQVDCIGLNTLLTGRMLPYDALPGLQNALSFSEAEWALLPGPARKFDLAACQAQGGSVLRLPLANPPSARQSDWNNCIRHCADPLLQCRKTCSENACNHCETAYETCQTACGSAPDARLAP